MHLSSDDRRQLQRASDVMLRPFDHTSPADYLKTVAREVRPLLGAFASVAAVRHGDGVVDIASDEWPAKTLADFAKWKLDDEGTRRALASGTEVMSIRTLVGANWDLYAEDPMVEHWYWANGVHDAIAYLLYWPDDNSVASIEFHSARFGLPRFGEEGEDLLRLLLPSLRAGSRLLYSLGKHRENLTRELDALGVPVCVCARDGTPVHMSPCLASTLAREPQAALVREEIAAAARTIAASEYRNKRRVAACAPAQAHRVVQTSTSRYRVSAALATYPMQYGATDVLVTVSLLSHETIEPMAIAQLYRMSLREAEVARLIGQGARNDAIAAALSISPHTVRRHTERVLAKLGVTNRSQVAVVLRG